MRIRAEDQETIGLAVVTLKSVGGPQASGPPNSLLNQSKPPRLQATPKPWIPQFPSKSVKATQTPSQPPNLGRPQFLSTSAKPNQTANQRTPNMLSKSGKATQTASQAPKPGTPPLPFYISQSQPYPKANQTPNTRLKPPKPQTSPKPGTPKSLLNQPKPGSKPAPKPGTPPTPFQISQTQPDPKPADPSILFLNHSRPRPQLNLGRPSISAKASQTPNQRTPRFPQSKTWEPAPKPGTPNSLLNQLKPLQASGQASFF